MSPSFTADEDATANNGSVVMDFDAKRAARSARLSFRLGGENFKMRAVRPEQLLAHQGGVNIKPSPELIEARRAVLRASIDHPPVNGNQSAEATLAAMDAEELEEAHEQATNEALLPHLDGVVLDLLNPADDSHARYRALREREDDPMTLGDLRSLVTWMLEAQAKEVEAETGRPTSPPSPSGPGLPATGGRLTGVSSLPAPPAAPTA